MSGDRNHRMQTSYIVHCTNSADFNITLDIMDLDDTVKEMKAATVMEDNSKGAAISDSKSDSKSKSESESEWSPIPAAYHLSTIGIHEVFLDPPPYMHTHTDTDTSMKVQADERDQEDHQHQYYTWEIIGNIKTRPEDFVVREIGGVNVHAHAREREFGQLASLEPNSESKSESESDPASKRLKMEVNVDANEHVPVDTQVNANVDTNTHQHKNGKGSIQNVDGIDVDVDDDEDKDEDGDGDGTTSNPIVQYENSQEAVVKQILMKCVQYGNVHSSSQDDGGDGDEHVNRNRNRGIEVFHKLEMLSKDASLKLSGNGNKNENDEDNGNDNVNNVDSASLNIATSTRIVIPPIGDGTLIRLQDNTEELEECYSPRKSTFRNRATFHKTMKRVFPLLVGSTMNEEGSLHEWNKSGSGLGSNRMNKGDLGTARYVMVSADTMFHGLIPYLLYPERDLPLLYSFRNNGCKGLPRRGGHDRNGRGRGRDRGGRGCGRGRGRHQSKGHSRESSSRDDSEVASQHQVMLYLKPDMERESRKEMHHLIAKMYRDFETGTKNNLPCLNGDGDKITTTAITVQWSRKAHNSWLKRKRKENAASVGTSTGSGDGSNQKQIFNTLCVMKKKQQEHHSAFTLLAAALKCRQSDIGLAGIKDMQAVTYQFCTLRNITPARAKNANKFLAHKNIELGNFKTVDWSLNRGDLKGNSFEIILRDLKRVEVKASSDGVVIERFVGCDQSHIDAMCERIRIHGFINFYGEQRVGEAGPSEEIGVRAGDVGKAMLQGDFSRAVHLLMTGRSKRKDGQYAESEDIRKMRDTFAKSNGDPIATLAVFPRNNALGRERTVLQGLKRYGKPLEALRCLHFSIRLFWINAYQSLVWNTMASERIKRFGAKPALGDLYRDKDSGEVKVVTKEDSIDIKQVVLPLVGKNIRYPENLIGDLYLNALKEDGVSFEADDILESSAKGAYRNLICEASNLECEPVLCPEDASMSKFKIRFSLQSGSYATMCLRELMVCTMGRTSKHITQ